MASLYIKDRETAELAGRRARRLGMTKTEAVRSALRAAEGNFPVVSSPKQTTLEWLREYRREHPLPPRVGLTADKAFYDWLSSDEDDVTSYGR